MPRILAVDDIEENLYYLQVLFEACGYAVICARDGAEALDFALTQPPDLIISDILMPRMDGFTLCRRWRAEPRLAAIPFVFYTATYTDPKDRDLALSLGADVFLLKPLEPEAIRETVRSLLQGSRTATFAPSPSHVEEPDSFLKEYNAALIRKLEDKLAQLEAANQKSAEAEEFIRAILDNSPLPTIAADTEGYIKLVNSAFCSLFGYHSFEAEGKLCADLIGCAGEDSEANLLRKQLAQKLFSPYSGKRRCKDGSVLEVEIFLGPMHTQDKTTGLVAIYRDVTQQRKLEEQLRQAQKLEAIGQFAATMAHDFNNLLGVMVAYSELISESTEPGSVLCHHADQIRQSCTRAAALTKQLLSFSRRQVLHPEMIDLGVFLKEMTGMLRRLIREDIELTIKLPPAAGQICMDRVQVEQVVLNLVANACDAMPKGGRLSLDLTNVEMEGEENNDGAPSYSGEFVRLAVRDSGMGMDNATLSRIFEPFFTTKPHGVGTGLGLASVQNILKQNGGEIRVSSQPGGGSLFEVYFPRIHEPVSLPGQPAKLTLCQGSETILLVEDEESLRLLISEMLSKLGYRVLTARSADDAAQLIQDAPDPLDLLVTDIVMPGMGGLELSELVWSFRPEMRVLYISGYSADHPSESANYRQQTAFLAKPFTLPQLATAIRRILDRKLEPAVLKLMPRRNIS